MISFNSVRMCVSLAVIAFALRNKPYASTNISPAVARRNYDSRNGMKWHAESSVALDTRIDRSMQLGPRDRLTRLTLCDVKSLKS